MLIDRLKAFWIFLKLLGRHYQEDGCQTTAAALTYQTLFAVVPLLTISFTVLSYFDAFEGMGGSLQNFLFENVVPDNVAMVEGYFMEFSSQARQLSVPSLVVIAVTAFLMLFTIERSFNDIWRIREPRRGFQRILVYWAILTLGPVLGVVSIATTTYVLSLPLLTDVANTIGFLQLLPIVLNIAFFTLMYVTVPNCYVPLRHALIGGISVALLFQVAMQLFGSVMAQSDLQVIYGTYAAVPLFLIWLYLSWTIVLFGAELTKGIGLFNSEKSEQIEPPFLQMLLILEEFFRCHRKGEVVMEKSMARLGHRIDMQRWNEHKSSLLNLGLIRVVEKGGLVLSRDLNEVSLWELYQALPWALPGGFEQADEGWQTVLNRTLADLYSSGEESLKFDVERLFRGEQA